MGTIRYRACGSDPEYSLELSRGCFHVTAALEGIVFHRFTWLNGWSFPLSSRVVRAVIEVIGLAHYFLGRSQEAGGFFHNHRIEICLQQLLKRDAIGSLLKI